jgi:serine/threonine protein kinase
MLSHYRLVERIGEGGMGVVYRARDEHLERDVAVKVLRPGAVGDESARNRFRKEALALSQLNHPNIATIYDFDTQDGVDFLAMEYVRGKTLSERLAGGSLSENETLGLGRQLAEGLIAAHAEGILHRDLKPGNLRITHDDRLKILDFGLAKMLRAPSETAPTETLRGAQVDERTDL